MRWPAESLWEQVAPMLPGFTVEVLFEVDSTNSELMRRARAGHTDPVLLVAEHQSAGRGRAGRAWHSQAKESLTFSLGLLLQPNDWSGLSLAVGVAIAEGLHADIRLKWPNDLWLAGDRKLGGILIETASAGTVGRYAIIGVGLNIVEPPADGLSTPPAALRELIAGIDPGQALLAVGLPLVQAVRQFEAEGFAPFQDGFARRDALLGRPLALSDGSTGRGQGVSGHGALLVHTAAGPVAIRNSEVSVRPA